MRLNVKALLKVKRVPYIIWYSKHELTHVLMGLAYAWFLRELWGDFSSYYVFLAVFGSLAIDLDHLFFFFTYGRNEPYAREVQKILKQGQFTYLIRYWRDNHKNNTGLASHNVYVLGFFLIFTLVSFGFDWKARVIFFGAVVLHLLFDILDDVWALGYINENWRHLRRKKTTDKKAFARR